MAGMKVWWRLLNWSLNGKETMSVFEWIARRIVLLRMNGVVLIRIWQVVVGLVFCFRYFPTRYA